MVLPDEGRPARQKLVEDSAEAVDIGRDGESLLPRRLFGRHVRRRADDGRRMGGLAAGAEALGQTEVGDVGTKRQGRLFLPCARSWTFGSSRMLPGLRSRCRMPRDGHDGPRGQFDLPAERLLRPCR